MKEIFKSKPTFEENRSKSKPTLGKKSEQIQTNNVKSWVKSKPIMVGISAKYRQNINKKGHKKTPHSYPVKGAMRR